MTLDTNPQNFEPRIAEQSSLRGTHQELEVDMQRLSREVLEKRKLPEYKDFSNKEIIKETIRPFIKPEEQGANIENKFAIEAGEKDFLPDYALDLPAEEKLQVEKLIDAVLHEGLKAIEEVKDNKNKYSARVVDTFHDSLSGKLSNELEKMKLI